MVDTGNFHHIKLTPPDEDEIIVVGEVVEPPEDPTRDHGCSARQSHSQDGFASNDHLVSPEKASDFCLQSGEAGAQTISAGFSDTSAEGENADSSYGMKDSYRETTLEDLQSDGAPFAQKAVIIAAIALIIVAIVYCFVFMR